MARTIICTSPQQASKPIFTLPIRLNLKERIKTNIVAILCTQRESEPNNLIMCPIVLLDIALWGVLSTFQQVGSMRVNLHYIMLKKIRKIQTYMKNVCTYTWSVFESKSFRQFQKISFFIFHICMLYLRGYHFYVGKF